MSIDSELRELMATIRAAGLRVTDDLRDLNPPAIAVKAGSVVLDRLCGEGTMTVELYLVAPDHGSNQGHKALAPMLKKLLTVVDPVQPVQLSMTMALSGQGGGLPAYLVTTEVSVEL